MKYLDEIIKLLVTGKIDYRTSIRLRMQLAFSTRHLNAVKEIKELSK